MRLKNSWWKLFSYLFNFLSFSFINIFLIIISMVTSAVTMITLLLFSTTVTSFLINFHYFVIIFYGIICFIFVLMNTIKMFGITYHDGTVLLLLTKPYSRKLIIISQYLSVVIVEFLFIFFNIFLIFLISIITETFIEINFADFLFIMIVKLFIFTICFSFLLTNGIIFVLSFNKVQNVFLIFIIFCSLFLLGGLPYNLVKNIDDNIILTFNNGSNFSLKTIKDTLLFENNLNKGLIKYSSITKKIFNFYNNMNLDELNNIDSNIEMNKRINFYNSLGLMENDINKKIKIASGHVNSWKADYGQPDYSNQDITIHITFDRYIIDFDELKINQTKASYFNDLLNIIDDYNRQFSMKNKGSGIDYFMDYQKSLAPDLLTYNLNSNLTYIISQTKPEKKDSVTNDVLNNLFLGSIDYNISGNLQLSYNQIFENPVYFALRSVESNIYHQVYNYKIITTMPIVINANYLKLINNQNFYLILNNINVIEQWNQLWTDLLGCYPNYWFNPLTTAEIDFDSQHNILFSYFEIKISLNNNQIINQNLIYFQNNKLIIIVYLVISNLLLILIFITYSIKNII